tara:strand:- start:142 stop:264 length:123 start_codon:yes stop_codon:yes gene_type:complete
VPDLTDFNISDKEATSFSREFKSNLLAADFSFDFDFAKFF